MQKKRSPRRSFSDSRDFAASKRRACILDPHDIIDLNDVELLRRFVTEYGKIIPARLTGVTAAQQRQIKKGVRRARNMGLLA